MSLDPSTSIKPRPLWARALLRKSGRLPGPPTEDEIRDAIRVLEEGYAEDDLYVEAERLLAEWGER